MKRCRRNMDDKENITTHKYIQSPLFIVCLIADSWTVIFRGILQNAKKFKILFIIWKNSYYLKEIKKFFIQGLGFIWNVNFYTVSDFYMLWLRKHFPCCNKLKKKKKSILNDKILPSFDTLKCMDFQNFLDLNMVRCIFNSIA